jgi:hypothetical protein
MHGARAVAKLKNAGISLMRSIKQILRRYQVFGAYTGFLWSPIKQYFLWTLWYLNVTCWLTHTYTYHSQFIPEGIAEVSQIFLRDNHVLPKLVNFEEHRRRDRW